MSPISALFLLLALNPTALQKAQAEIDAVIGPSRLPTFEDRSSLPYVDAVVKEVLRWHAVVPIGVCHRSVEDDIHDGYLIPKGSLVFANIEGMLHDKRYYKNPMKFDPARHLPELSGRPAERDPRDICFGFGRRICPGINLADDNLFITCASVCAVFNVNKFVENGKIVEPVYDKTPGLITHPTPYKVSITPRSDSAVQLIRGEA